jgi:hypothetical protein
LAARRGYHSDARGQYRPRPRAGLIGAVVTAWTAVALVGSYELLVMLVLKYRRTVHLTLGTMRIYYTSCRVTRSARPTVSRQRWTARNHDHLPGSIRATSAACRECNCNALTWGNPVSEGGLHQKAHGCFQRSSRWSNSGE